MSKMNDLATVLDDLVTAADGLKQCAQDLLTAADRLRGLYDAEGAEEPKPEKAPKTRKPRPGPAPVTNETAAGSGEPAPGPEPEAPAYTKEQIRGMLSALAGNGRREEARELVSRYADGGSFSDIDPARYAELAEEVRKLHA